MSAQKQKTSEGKQALSIQAASAVQLGPPFAEQGPLPDGRWTRFKRPPVDDPGFWTAVRHFPSSGGLVAQLGAKAGTGHVGSSLYIGYEYTFTATQTGQHSFGLSLEMGPVTKLPRGGKVDTLALLQTFGPDGQIIDYDFNLYEGARIWLCVSREVRKGALYAVQLGVAPIIENAGNGTYCEIIVRTARLEMKLPYAAFSSQALRPAAAGGDDLIQRLLDPRGKQTSEDISHADAAELIGLPILKR